MSLTDLPNELLIEIVKEIAPYNDHEPNIGVNAAWSSLSTYHQSLEVPRFETSPEILESLAEPVMVSIYEDLLALRSTCSTLNAICVPFVFKNLNILRDLDTPFEEFYNFIVEPYALYAKVIRIQLSDSVTDEDAARILSVTTNATDLLLYHRSFQRSDSSKDINWMRNTTTATVNLIENHSLRSLGIYAESIVGERPRWGVLNDIEGALFLLLQILTNPMASTSLIKLDIALYNIPEKIYDLLRQNLPSLTSFTIHHAFNTSLPRFWDTSSDQHLKWNRSKNLNRLSLGRCTNAYAPHIPHLVRHIPSLKHLLVSACGELDDEVDVPPYDWYSSENALWRIRLPLDTFQIEYMQVWEIKAIAVIPVRNMIFPDTSEAELIRALSADINYFPKLEIISVKSPNVRSGRDLLDQPTGTEFKDLEEICQRRDVSIVKNAVPISLYPLHP